VLAGALLVLAMLRLGAAQRSPEFGR